MLFFIYGEPVEQNKIDFVRKVRKIDIPGCPWLIMGDLNICNKWEDKWGKKPINRRIAAEYGEFLFDLSLSELVFSGNKFTWSNMQRGQARIMEHIDKGISNVEWRMAP